VQTAAERSVPEVLRAAARLTNDENHTWRVGALTEGRVVQILANVGDLVEQGRVLARIHSHDVHDSRAEYRKAQAELIRAKSAVDYAQRVRDRAKRLLDLKAGSVEQLEHAQTGLRNAEAALATANSEVERMRSHLVEYLGVSIEDDHASHGGAIDDPDLVPVRAPANGTVITRNVTSGTVVTPANDLFVISNLSSVWAVAEVGEEHLSKLRVGMPVRIFVQAWAGQPFMGRIGKIGETLDPSTRTVRVRVDLPNAQGRLKPEMFGTAEISLGGSQSAVFVPEEATQEVRGQMVLFVRTAPDRFEVRPVETGRTLDGSIEIRRGIRSGEAVATRGAFILKSEFLKSTIAGE
jgi:cobalt-zinc-cadmium efflux system membrane fusion protein